MGYHEVARQDGVHVLAEKCSTCIFRPGNPMQLEQGRVKGMVADCIRDQGTIPCHKTLYERGLKPAICRGFYDAYRDHIQLLQLAERLGCIVEDQTPAEV